MVMLDVSIKSIFHTDFIFRLIQKEIEEKKITIQLLNLNILEF